MQLELTTADVQSRLWKKVDAALRAELDELRRANDSIHLGKLKTRGLRAQIALIEEILSLADSASDGVVGLHESDDDQLIPLRALRGE